MSHQLEIIPLVDGSAFSRTFTLRDAAGMPITYEPTDTLAATVSVGEDRASVFSPTVAWLDAAEGTVNYSHTNAQGALLEPDTDYTVFLSITRGTATVTSPLFRFRVQARPDDATAPVKYATVDDMLLYCGDILRALGEGSDQGGFEEQLAEAARWTNRSIIGRAGELWDRSVGGYVGTDEVWRATFDAVSDAGDETTTPLREDFLAVIQEYLDPDEDGDIGLLLDPDYDSEIIAANAMYAAALVYGRQVGTSGTFFQEINEYQKLAQLWRMQAIWKLTTARFRLDPERDGSITLIL
jgi:hypothetical protein